LVLSKQRLEGFQVARRETLQQLHLPLSILNYGEIRLWLQAVCTLERDMRRAKKNARSDDASGRFPQKDGELKSPLQKALVDVVLLPVQRGVGLDDDVLVRGLLEFVDEHGLAGLQSLGDFGIHADGEIPAFVIRRRHPARSGLALITQPAAPPDHATAAPPTAPLPAPPPPPPPPP